MSICMSLTRHAVMLELSLTGFGKQPFFTPSHQVVLLMGKTFKIVERRTKPVVGIVVIFELWLVPKCIVDSILRYRVIRHYVHYQISMYLLRTI
jgi:hypothetical protein